MQDGLILGAAYFAEYSQGLQVAFERVPVEAGVQLHLAEVVESLRLAPPVTDVAVQRQRLPEPRHRVRVVAQMPAGDRGVTQRVGLAVLVRGVTVQRPGLAEVRQRLPGPRRALVHQAD